MRRVALAAFLALAGVSIPHTLLAQTADTLGTRAQGMGGAFVAVVDDASAVYWNPGALAKSSYFSLVLDRSEGRTAVDRPEAGSRSGFLLALAAPALGLSYYRLRTTALKPPDIATDAAELGRNVLGPGDVRLDMLVTHHLGATLVQSITDGISVGTTLKIVRGTAASRLVRDANRSELLSDATDVRGEGTSRFDADVGILASSRLFRVGLTLRNATEPEFDTPGQGGVVVLARQARIGLALLPSDRWTVAADVDLLRTQGVVARTRDAAFGVEGRVSRRATVRSGVRVNTLEDARGERAASVSAGASYAMRASFLVDAQYTTGTDSSVRGWGLAGRFVY